MAMIRRSGVFLAAFVFGWGLAGAAVAVGAAEPAGKCLSGRTAAAPQHKCGPDDDRDEKRAPQPAEPVLGEVPLPLS
jgi:hypothetical protein